MKVQVSQKIFYMMMKLLQYHGLCTSHDIVFHTFLINDSKINDNKVSISDIHINMYANTTKKFS